MRFIEKGPSIPDDLLIARDEGRVVFFCGSGVSIAKAGLPNFFGLAEKVIAALGALPDSAAVKLVKEAQDIDRRIGVSGVIPADRVFGLLEREFHPKDIQARVAEALVPITRDLSAHSTILNLATSPEGVVRLVTTNFDRLFEDCDPKLTTWKPPRLPDPLRPADLNGIVYLHGRVNPSYTGAEDDGFVLSISEFGRAYLSDGWATTFVRQIIDRFNVVFIGYSADDPPVQYLLEALSKSSGERQGVYAFQAGETNDAVSRWRHKGVKAIAYDPEGDHQFLWRTLEAWADRAKDVDGWYSRVIEQARKGPETLAPHERGQVAHVVSTVAGARRFASGDNPPQADWLCVFDQFRRYATPGRRTSLLDDGPIVDPFTLFGIDSDTPPPTIDPDNHFASREAPKDAWSAFSLVASDRSALMDQNLPSLRGPYASAPAGLPPRLSHLATWITKVASQPAAVWWAAHQVSLHKDIRDRITWQLEDPSTTLPLFIKSAWRFLFEAWENDNFESTRDWYRLKNLVDKEGWSTFAVRQYEMAGRPHFKIEARSLDSPIPPTRETVSINIILPRHIEYPKIADQIKIADDWLQPVVAALRRNLELATVLESEIGALETAILSPVVPDAGNDGVVYQRKYGLSGALIEYSTLFERLLKFDPRKAKAEFGAWPFQKDKVFTRLRVWAAGKPGFLTIKEFSAVIAELSDEDFWEPRGRRDLNFSLSKRWSELGNDERLDIENRIVAGPPRWPAEEHEHWEERKAWSVLVRLHWLSEQGCSLSLDLTKITAELQTKAPKWEPEYAASAVASLEPKVGWVETDTTYSGLLSIPLSSILVRSRELSGREFLLEHDPFKGLASERPIRAFGALLSAADRGEYPEWAWRTFLNLEARKTDRPRFLLFLSEHLRHLPDVAVQNLINPLSDWLLGVSASLADACPQNFRAIVWLLTSALSAKPEIGQSGIVKGNKETDWTLDAINAPVGKIAQALFQDPASSGLNANAGLPSEWTEQVERLLHLPNDLRRHALVIFSHNLNWLYSIESKWTESNLVCLFDVNNEDQEAVWAGFLWGARVPHKALYERLKPKLLEYATTRQSDRISNSEVLAGMILSGWGAVNPTTGERLVTHDELRTLLVKADDDFRSQILWQAENWAGKARTDSESPWADQLVVLLKEVWPRQLAAKSAKISSRMCDIAFADKERFPQLVEVVLPLVTKIDQDHLMIPNLRKSKDNIVDQFPEETLTLLYAVLPDNARAWPYGIEDTLQRIGDANKSLNTDGRLITLRRRWESR